MRILADKDIYREIIEEGVLKAGKRVWIATANLKDMHVRKGLRFVSLLDILAEQCKQGISIRIIHAAEPSQAFRESFDRHREMIQGDVEFLFCPRVHFKMVAVDNRFVFIGSANFTGAGLGAKSERKRNFELGVIYTETGPMRELTGYFDRLWMGEHCPLCQRKEICPDPIV